MTNYPKLEDVLQAAREAVADNLHEGIVTANSWPETKERMAMGDSIAVAMSNKVMELLLASSEADQARGISGADRQRLMLELEPLHPGGARHISEG